MPRLTIFLEAQDSPETISKTLTSVLEQEDVDFELLIHGKVKAAEIVNSFGDRRIQFTSDKFKAALKQTSSPFFAIIDPGVVLLRGALKKMILEFEKDQHIATVSSFFFLVDQQEQITRDQFRSRRQRFIEAIELGKQLVGYFRIYRTNILRSAGVASDRKMHLRIDKNGFRTSVVPEHLYSWKGESGKTINFRKPRKNQRIILSRFRRMGRFFVRVYYQKLLLQLPEWPVPFSRNGNPPTQKRIAYYIWHFPVLSQTFVNRELSALVNAGLPVLVLADEPEDAHLADDNARILTKQTRYLLPVEDKEIRKHKRHFFLRNPFRYLNLYLFVITHRYGPFKNFPRDRKVFSKAVYLAGILKEEKIDHIHSPWTDRCAFLSLLASKLLGISYSVQSRAHEIHRKMYLYGVREILENASFAITNSEYNRSYLQSLVREESRKRIIRIYNGIDLDRFVPEASRRRENQVFHVLSVARLIEQKGLVYLLKACRILKDRGISFHCEIVGGPEEQLFINYALDLRKLHIRLELSDVVQFSGVLPFQQVLEKYRNADLFVMPSVIGKDGSRDITPNALIEAMAMKLPVISTTVTAIPEIVEHGVSGLLVPPHDENALAEAMSKLIEDPALRQQLAENARKKVEYIFDITQNIQQYLSLFQGTGKF